MKKNVIVLQVDPCTRIVLTVIAVCLAGMLLKPLFAVLPAVAQSKELKKEIQDVHIALISGQPPEVALPLRVNIARARTIGVKIEESPTLPVAIEKSATVPVSIEKPEALTVNIAKSEPLPVWVGTDDGRVHVTRDGGQNWSRIDERAKGVPPGTWVPMISPSPHDASSAFVVFDNHRRGDMQPYAFRVGDYGRDWRNLVSGPVSGYALSLLQDPVDPALLFLGTEFGLFVSTDDGGQWLKFAAGVPTVSVMDMAVQRRENDLVLGTHGRSVYVLDDYSALRGLDANDFEQRLAILSTTQGQQYTANQTGRRPASPAPANSARTTSPTAC